MNGVVEMLRGNGWVPPTTCDKEVMGIVGYGSIGMELAKRARALGMKVLIAARKGGPALPGRRSFDDMISHSSIIVLAVLLLPETLGLIGKAEFQAMKKNGILVNVSRGGVVDENALVVALKENFIAGAGTDVCWKEPATPQDSSILAEDTRGLNLVVTPHIAWLTQRTQDSFGRCLRDNIVSWLRG